MTRHGLDILNNILWNTVNLVTTFYIKYNTPDRIVLYCDGK